MLGIVFIILKSILLALLGLVLLLLILVNIILWVPIRYQAYGSKYDAILAYGKVDYLFGLIRVRFRYDGDGIRYEVKILWFKVYDSTVPRKNKKAIKKNPIKDTKKSYPDEKENKLIEENPVEEKKEVVAEVPQESKETIIETKNNRSKEQASASKEPIKDEKSLKSKKAKKTKKQKKAKNGKSEPSLWEQIQSGIELLRSEKHKGVLKFVLGKVYKMIKSILPRHIEADIIFGFDDPATTGLVLGGVSMFYPCYGKTVVIIPNFEEVMFEGDIKIRGKIVIGVIVYYGLRVIIDKRVRSIIKAVR
ncbi:DUF2953 domain-containing protein [Petrocella sp. FN5]|uniref:DUF2953 domain-containing protein n=1 Tax=Petrocella sp. FN5 TaxID=3032002 RepID=UPI0023DCCD18|nr:DUF2953 domain-containing protein [Petrocella sp. FN5]MDF1617832.1 DUF2953 domain-containing protein [Petrocella sp. FN5]